MFFFRLKKRKKKNKHQGVCVYINIYMVKVGVVGYKPREVCHMYRKVQRNLMNGMVEAIKYI